MDLESVRKVVTQHYGKDIQTATNKLSDMLSYMWRKEMLDRYPQVANDNTKARYTYDLKQPKTPQPEVRPPNPSKKPSFTVIEGKDSITFEFDRFTLIVRRE
jgi:hypothetical protein